MPPGRKSPLEEAGGYEPKQRTSGKETLLTRENPSRRCRPGDNLMTGPKLSFFGPRNQLGWQNEELRKAILWQITAGDT